MSAISLVIRSDKITPHLAALSSDDLMRRCTLAAATAIAGLATRAFDEPSLRPTAWAPRSKRSKGKHPLLIKSGNMRQGIHAKSLGADTAQVGTPVIYGAAQQLGYKPRNLPARPFFPVLADQLTGVANDEIGDVLSVLIGKAGGK